MDYSKAQSVGQFVEEYRRQLSSERSVAASSSDFDRLIDDVLIEPQLQGVASDDLLVVTAMWWFGPRRAGIPSSDLRDALVTLTRTLLPDEGSPRRRLVEVIIAYGCGSWREVQEGKGGWEDRWQGALDWVTHLVFGWMRATAAWLQFDVQLRGYAFSVSFPSWIAAEELASLLWLGRGFVAEMVTETPCRYS